MGISRSEVKLMAKEQLRGNVGILFLITLIAGLLIGASACLCGVGVIFLGYPIAFGVDICVYMNMVRGESPAIEMIFEPFKKFYWKAIGIILLQSILIALWSLLLFVPGIIKACSYSQALYILNENPEMGVVDCITASRQMMEGHKMEYFILGLSFIPWLLLCAVTAGIAFIYVAPYMQLTMVDYYDKVKAAFVSTNPVDTAVME